MKNLAGLMKQAQQMQSKMQEMQSKFESIEVEGVAGAGLVAVTLNGKIYVFGGFVGRGRETSGFDTVAWLDFQTGHRASFMLPPGDATSEAVFVPRGPAAAEGDGWLLSVVWRGEARRSDLIVLDTAAIGHGPVATMHLPHRVPFGFHGNWMQAA